MNFFSGFGKVMGWNALKSTSGFLGRGEFRNAGMSLRRWATGRDIARPERMKTLGGRYGGIGGGIGGLWGYHEGTKRYR
jgi:hypothetical protein